MNRKYEFSIGEKVRIKAGPFQAFTAEVVAINAQDRVLKVKVDIFGRTQPIELSFLDVEKLNWKRDDPDN
jgi:transcriptional antiterminator NusG